MANEAATLERVQNAAAVLASLVAHDRIYAPILHRLQAEEVALERAQRGPAIAPRRRASQ
jgi:hypothetical protein